MCKKSYKIVVCLVVLLILRVVQYSNAQNNAAVTLDDITEKVVLTTVRHIYFAEEEILFSAQYFINQKKITPVLSKVLYVELINCFDNQPVYQGKFEINDFNSHGSVAIPAGVPSGNYMLRAYTQYQRNFGWRSFSQLFVTIINPLNSDNLLTAGFQTDTIEITSEGNILLDNVKNKVVIRIPKNILKNGIDFFITDSDSNITETLKVADNGFTQTDFTGSFGKSYFLNIKNRNGETVTKAFTKVQQKGIQTQTERSENNVKYHIQSLGIVNNNNIPDYTVNVYSGTLKKLFTKNIALNKASFVIDISNNLFADGLNYIVLTNSGGEIENINTLFFRTGTLNEINIFTDKTSFKTREKVNTAIALTNEKTDGFPVVSVSVVKKGANKEDHFFKPSVYLKNEFLLNDYLVTNTGLDNTTRDQILVLFSKYVNRHLFTSVVNNPKNQFLQYLPEIRGITLNGIVRNKKTLEPVANQKVYLAVLFKNPQLHVSKSKEDGSFVFSLSRVNGINDIFICRENDGEEELEILISSSFSNEFPEIGNFPVFVDSASAEIIDDIFINAQISKTFYPNSEINSQNELQKHIFNIDNGKSTTNLSDFVTLKNMEELFTEIIPTAKFRKNKGQYSFAVFDSNGNIISENPLLLLDKIPVFDANKIMELDISLIEKVEVINKNYILGENTFHGVIMLTTKTKNFAGIKFPKSSVFIEYPTINKPINKKYLFNENLTLNKRIPDFRTTLFWAPGIKLDNKGYEFNFPTSDSKGEYEIVVKGYSPDGEIYFGRKQITVD